MWALDNQTPFAAERCWVRDKNGAEIWVLAIKGTFEINANGQITLADQQVPVTIAPEFTDDNARELLYDTDLPECKQATDVILNGTAYAPEGVFAKQWAVNLRVGPIDKKLLISGNRVWQSGLLKPSPSEPQPIALLPLSYRYAFGGEAPSSSDDTPSFYEANPIGCGYTQEKAATLGQAIPNIEYLSTPVHGRQDQSVAAGFAAIPPHWQPRTQFAGTYDQVWVDQRQPLFPEDFDPQFFQCAPKDQQVPGFLKGGELVELTNLAPTERLSFHLPKASFYLRTSFTDGHNKIQRANLHTVIIEPDSHRIMMVWHSHLSCHHRVNQLDKTQIRLKKRILQPTSDTTPPIWTG